MAREAARSTADGPGDPLQRSELRAERLKKRYRSRVVVKDVSLDVRSGENLIAPSIRQPGS